MYQSKESDAATVGLGLTGYYAVWEPGFAGNFSDGMEIDPGYIFGPVFAVSFMDSWSIGLVAMTNMFTPSFESSYGESGSVNFTEPGSGNPYTGDYSYEVTGTVDRLDVDLSLSYSLNSLIKPFIGFKTYYYGSSGDTEGHSTYTNTSIPETYNNSSYGVFNFFGYGGAAGISLAHNITDNISVSWNNSAVYYFSIEYYVEKPVTPSDASSDYNSFTSGSSGGTAWGYNTQFLFTYFFDTTGIAVSAGGRFQFTKYSFVDVDMNNDYIYGPTLSVIYYF